jgi:hypothetical protein
MAFGTCPACGGHSIRGSKINGPIERLQSLIGVVPFRCRQCNTRFTASLWDLRNSRYARCPSCRGTELGHWSEQFYNAPAGVRLLLALGATRYRCEFCRYNFASFRACKDRFSWKKRREAAKSAAAGAGEQGGRAL